MMNKTKKAYVLCIISIALLTLTVFASPTKAAGEVTLTPNSNAMVGSTVTITGTGFSASVSVGIGFGAEVAVTNDVYTTFSGSGMGPYTATLKNVPIKPGSFSMHWDTSGTTSDWTDNGDGTLSSTSTYSAGGIVNYVTGSFGRSSTTDISTYELSATTSYTRYEHNVTPQGGVTTDGAGSFTGSITIPSVPNGVYTVTVVDSSGNIATASIGVGMDVPENLTFVVAIFLTCAAVVAGVIIRRKPKTTIRE